MQWSKMMFNMPSVEPEVCKKCGKKLSRDEVGLHKKMINRGAAEFFCITCLAEYFGVTEDSLRERIEHFREQGCLLFQ